jgi:CubicO group peptidase (beta-lactamase class C family)
VLTQKNDSVQNKQQINRPLWRNRRPLFLTVVFVTVGVIPLLAFVCVSWSETRSAISPTYLSVVQQSARTEVNAPDTTVANAALIASKVDSLMQSDLANQKFTGSVLVALGNQVILDKGYGQADDTDQIANTPDTRYFLGSVTKEFTATAILLLQQQGKLQVQDLICKYIANCPSPWQAITIREVLMHTSGIPQPDTSQLSGASPQAWIASFDDLPLEFTPGAQFDYCSVCYEILAYTVQQVSGQPYDQYLQQMIFDPLQMKRTGFDSDAYYAQAGHATGYASWQSPAEELGWSLGSQWDFLNGSGLLYSTVNDLFLWDQALYTNVLLPQQVLSAAFTPYVSAAELFPGSEYGYGWFITKSPVAGHRLIWHDGVIDGFRNYIGRYVDDHVTVIALSNLATTDPVPIGQSIGNTVFANMS